MQQGPLADYMSYTSQTEGVLRGLAALEPETLAVIAWLVLHRQERQAAYRPRGSDQRKLPSGVKAKPRADDWRVLRE